MTPIKTPERESEDAIGNIRNEPANSFLSTWISRRPLVVLLFVCAGTLFSGLGSSRLWDRDEPRNANCTVEMLAANDWIVPVFNAQLRTHKPILLYWSQMLSYQVVGVNSWGARLPSALVGLLTILGVWYLGQRVVSRSFGFWAAAGLATSLMFVVAARAATPDALLVGFSAGGIIGMVLAYRETPGSRQRFGFFALAAASLGCALLAKGPVGLILPMAVVVAHQWIETRRVRHFFSTLSVSIAAIAIALPWYVWVGLRTDGLWLRGFFLDHNLGRAMDSMEGHGGGVWYYPAAALLGLFPWSLIVIPVALWTRRNVRGSDPQAVMVRLGMVWLGMYIVAFSFASTKLPSYITPAYPGACLLIGGCLADWSERRLMIPRWLGRTAAVVFASAAVAIVVGLAVAGNQVGSVSIMGLSIVGSLFLWPALMAWRESDGGSVPRLTGALTGSNSWLPVSVLVSGCLLLLVVFGIGGPLADSQRNELDVFAMAGDERNSTDDAEGFRSSSRWLAVGTIEPSWVFYLREPIRECTLGIEPEVGGLRDAASHLAEPGNFVIVDQENLAALQSLVDSNVSYATVTCFRRFLRDETTIVLTSLPVGPGGIGQQGVQDRLERRTAEGSKNSHLERR